MVLFVRKVGILGGGTMGSQIAGIMALNGKDVVIKDVSEELVNVAYSSIEKNLSDLMNYHATRSTKEIERIEKSYGIILSEEQKDKIKDRLKPKYDESMKKETLSRIKTTTNWDEFSNVDLVIEAIVEDINVKRDTFKALDEHTPTHAILATNTSSLSITEIASATNRKDKTLGVHFFNPPITLPLVEMIPGLETSEETINDMIDFIASLRNHRYPLQPIKVKEVPGFLVNRILFAMLNEAFSAYEEGIASMRDIDLAMKSGAGMPLGPFELSDLIGIDVLYHVDEEMKRMLGGNKMQRPVQILRKMYYTGRYGRKTKRGFYDYP